MNENQQIIYTGQNPEACIRRMKGFLYPKIIQKKKKYGSPAEDQVKKTLISTGDSYFKIQNLKIGINRQDSPVYQFEG